MARKTIIQVKTEDYNLKDDEARKQIDSLRQEVNEELNTIVKENNLLLTNLINRIEILEGNGGVSIDDTIISTEKTWSSSKINNQLEKTDLLPIKTTNYVMQDKVPSGNATDEYKGVVYLFDDVIFPNTEEVKKLNCEVTYIWDNEEITKNIELEYVTPYIVQNNAKDYLGEDIDNNCIVMFSSHYYTGDEIEKCNIIVCSDLENMIFPKVTKCTLFYENYSNLLKNEHIESLDFDKLTNVAVDFESDIINKPAMLSRVVEPTTLEKKYMLLNIEHFVKLFNNKFEKEISKINDVAKEGDTYTPNTINSYGNIEVNSKSTEIGSGQFIADIEDYNTHYIIALGYNVKLEYKNKRYSTYDNWKSIELNDTSVFQIVEADALGGGLYVRFKRINDNEVGRITSLYILDKDKILNKSDLDNKIDKSQLSFNENGELIVTINGVSKTFVPKS